MGNPITSQELAVMFEQLLAMPPSRAGKRLCSERELSSRLGVDRMKIQRSFDVLVDKGILARRPGSGTFVRKVPKSTQKSTRFNFGKKALSTNDLFAELSSTPIPRQIEKKHRKLKLGLLANDRWESETNRAMIAGIVERVKQEGHDLEVYSAIDSAGIPHSSAWLADNLRASSCDGYILWSFYAPLLHDAFDSKLPPAVFLGEGERQDDLNFAPLVRINLEDAIVRSLRLLAKENYRRIGFIHFHFPKRASSEQSIYDETLSKLGLSYRSMEPCSLDKRQTFEAVERMFNKSRPPEAVYVADDIVLRNVALAWEKLGIVPGVDIGVITHASRSNPLPPGYEWSKMEFHPFQAGRMAVDSLLQDISTVEEELCSFEHIAVWKPGKTHSISSKH